MSSALKSLLLGMCIDALESTTNSRSSGDFEMGTGTASISTREQNVALSLSFELVRRFMCVVGTLSWWRLVMF